MSGLPVKICGLSTIETLDATLSGGASHIGFVFFPKSPRHVSVDQAAALGQRVQGRAKSVGLFVNPHPAEVAAIRSRVPLDIIQLHGDESPDLALEIGGEIWKAIPVRTGEDLKAATRWKGVASRILYDAKPPAGSPLPGGTGIRIDWTVMQGHAHPLPWILAGGLDSENLAEAVRVTGASMADVSSGVESSPGVKDVDKIAAFLKAASQL